LIGQGVIYLYNQSYIEINNLEITNSPNGPINSNYFVGLFQNGNNPLGADRRGIMVAIDNYGTANHIYLKNLDVHHVKGQLGSGNTTQNGAIPKRTGGIYFSVVGITEQTSSFSRFNDILIDGCNINYCENIGLAFDNEWNVYYPGGQNSSIPADVTEYNNWFNRKFSNIKVSNNIIHHIGKNAMIIRCTDETGLIEYNTCYETALGTTGNTMFTARAKGTIFQYNEGSFNRSTTQTIEPGNIDGCMYDPDFGSVGIIFQYSYSHDNSEGIYWGCNTRGANNNTTGIPDPGDVGCTLRYCVSQNDKGSLVFFNYSSAGNEIYNNIFYTSPGISGNIIHENSGNNHTYNYFNNIIYNLSTTQNYSFGSGTGIQTRTISNNVFFGQHPTGATTGEPADPYKIIADPKFIHPGSGGIGLNTVNGYKLLTTSPALSSGLVVSNNGGKDYFGNVVTAASAPNRGFFEGLGQGTLPLQLSHFSAVKRNNQSLLNWTSEFEENSSHFEIERSSNGTNYFKIGDLQSAGNSSVKKYYSFTDALPAKQKNFYRLRIVDANAAAEFSPVRLLYFDKGSQIRLFPNPTKDYLIVQLVDFSNEPVIFKFFDMEGKLIYNYITKSGYYFTINIKDFPTGVYIIQINKSSKNGGVEALRFVKQ
ncbi:MAG: T9SS type A sorting domain-containing protein, partial [Ferruginibacter sp.]|nr:T9SS type A sorting domain-containing protein [Ferruginibacter sp.]